MANNSDFSLLWDGVSGDQEAFRHTSALVHGKVAVASLWPFLSSAVDEKDFDNRLQLRLERIEASVDPSVYEEVVSSLRDDFRAVTAASDDPYSTGERKACPACNGWGSYGGSHAGSEDSQTCEDCNGKGHLTKDDPARKRWYGTEAKLAAKGEDDPDVKKVHDQAERQNDDETNDHKDPRGRDKTASKDQLTDDDHITKYHNWAKEQGHNPDDLKTLKIYEKTVPGIGRARADKIADVYHGEDTTWRSNHREASATNDPRHPRYEHNLDGVKMRNKDYSDQEIEDEYRHANERDDAEDAWLARQATNYQPDPTAPQRYYAPYQSLNQVPVDNGDLQDADGFVKDLAEGEGRTPERYQFQMTPGQWNAHDGMPERPMPFSQERGYQPVASMFDKEGFLVSSGASQWSNEPISHATVLEDDEDPEAAVGGGTTLKKGDRVPLLGYSDPKRDKNGKAWAIVKHPSGGEHWIDPNKLTVHGSRAVESYGKHVDKGPRPDIFDEGYQHGLSGQNRWGFGGHPATESYSSGYDAGRSDAGTSPADDQEWDDDYKPHHNASRKTAASYVNTPEPKPGAKVDCPTCGGYGVRQSLDDSERQRGIHDPCYHCGTTGKVDAHGEWANAEYERGHDHGSQALPPEHPASSEYIEGHQKGYEENKFYHHPDNYRIKRDGQDTYVSPGAKQYDDEVDAAGDWGEGAPFHPYRQASRFDKEGFLIESFEGRGVDPLTDAAPGTPTNANPYYFSEGQNGMTGDGFPQSPTQDPQDRVNELYGDVAPQVSSGSTEGYIDGQGYSRNASARPNFNVAAQGNSDATVARSAGDPVPHRHPAEDDRDLDEVLFSGTASKQPSHKMYPLNCIVCGQTYHSGTPTSVAFNQHVQDHFDQDQGIDPRDGFDYGPPDKPKYTASSTDGKIVGHCPGCDQPLRRHETLHGDELRHLHNNHIRCQGEKKVKDQSGSSTHGGGDAGNNDDEDLEGSKQKKKHAVLPYGSNIENLENPYTFQEAMNYSKGYGTHMAGLAEVLPELAEGEGSSFLPQMPSGEKSQKSDSGEDDNPANKWWLPPSTSSLPQFFDPGLLASQANVSNGTTHVAGDYLGRPDATNPTGRGPDEYKARTWNAFETTRPMQTPDDRNVNTPVLPSDPIHTRNINSPNPGEELRENDRLETTRPEDEEED